ncbi:MAG: phospholipase D-like domain-containing protein [Gemmatimonadota bacterium]|nr:phospholipase D-like domain-containing protein [Gemmatimonadota bacterium]
MHDRGAAPQHRRRWRRWIIGAVLVTLVAAPLLLLALVGLPHVFRRPLVRLVMRENATGQAPALGDPAFDTTFELVTGARLTAGNRVEVLSNGDEIFPGLWHDLRAARRSITMQMYYAGPGAVIDSTVRILAERARAGVPVFYLYDAFGAQTTPVPLLDTLRASGVRVAAFAPIRWYALDRANHRSHIRAVVIDAEIGYTGGFGLDDKWLGRGRRRGEWRETNARFEGPVVAQLQSTFVATWAETTGEIHEGARLLAADSAPALPVAAGARAALAYSPALSGSTLAARLIAISIAGAQERLYITNAYFIPQADFVELLVRAARRGVDVRVLTNSGLTDVVSTWLAGRSRYETLLAAGVRIYEYQPTTLHSKTFVADGVWSSIGTMNFDNRSLAYNSEVALVTRDAVVGAVMESVFMADLRLSEEIRLESFRRRSRWMRLRERGASALAGIL